MSDGAPPYAPPEHLRYGFTARHVRCDCCQLDYLPQHIGQEGTTARSWWLCGNCMSKPRRSYTVPEGFRVEPLVRTRHRYRHTRHEEVKRAIGLVAA